MIGRCDQHVFERAHPFDVLRVHPELVDEIDRSAGEENVGRNPDHQPGQVKNEAEKTAAGLPQGRSEIVILALVMHDVRCPEQVDLMAEPVKPVVGKIVRDQRKNPDSESGIRQIEQVKTTGSRVVEPGAQSQEHQASKPTDAAQGNTGDGIGQTVGVSPAGQAIYPLGQDQADKERYGVQDDLHEKFSCRGSLLNPSSDA